MCGICGKLVEGEGAEAAVTEPLLRAMSGRMVHRGPDGEGVLVRHYRDRSIGLGHRRLSIIDLTTKESDLEDIFLMMTQDHEA